MQAILRLEADHRRPGFPARSFIKVGEDNQPNDGEWHDTPDKAWRWKGDTSSDEIVGHYFVYPIYYDLVADDSEKPALRAALDRITNHIVDNNYQLIDVDGQRTRWGWWAPELIWEDADETGLRALHLLSHLRVAVHMTGDPAHRKKFRAAYDDLIARHRYHLLTRNQKVMVPGHINHSDDELAFLSFYPLLRYETEAPLLADLQGEPGAQLADRASGAQPALERHLRGRHRREGIRQGGVAAHAAGDPDGSREWTVTNSHRQDVPVDPLADRFKRRQALVVLPYDELPMSKWNGNPYNLDGGNGGRSEDDGAISCCRIGWGGFTACSKSEAVDRGPRSAVRVRGGPFEGGVEARHPVAMSRRFHAIASGSRTDRGLRDHGRGHVTIPSTPCPLPSSASKASASATAAPSPSPTSRSRCSRERSSA